MPRGVKVGVPVVRTHALMSPWNEDANLNVVDRLVMDVTFQFEMSPLNADAS